MFHRGVHKVACKMENFSKFRLLSVHAQKNKELVANSDASEVEFHAKLAPKWWDPNGPMKPLHQLNEIRVPFIRDGIVARGSVDPQLINTSKVLQGQNLLEVGCGVGLLTERLAALNANVIGIDLGEQVIETAKEHVAKCNPSLVPRIKYQVEPIQSHAQNNKEAYDAVIVSEVLEHIADKEPFLKSCVDTVKPGGSIFITTLSKSAPMWFAGVFLAEYVFNLVPRGTHHWDKMISAIDVQRMLDSMNCQTVLVNGFIYEFWRNSWKWITPTNMCYALQAVKMKTLTK